MPMTVEKKITTSGLKKGDVVGVSSNGSPNHLTFVPLDRVEGKVKWYHVYLENGQHFRVERDALWTVKREEKTEEEKLADQRRYDVLTLSSALDGLTGDPTEKFITALQSNYEKGWLPANYSDVGNFLERQALWLIGRDIELSIEQLRNNDDAPDAWKIDEDEQLLTGWAYWYFEETRRTVYPTSPLNRSTSQMSNLLDDLKEWARAKVLDDLKYITYREDGAFLRRVKEIKTWNAEQLERKNWS
jgi:hypothetical protein